MPPIGQLAYSIHLDAPAVFATASEPTQVTSSAGYVPGSSVWGALAARWIDRNVASGPPERDPDFHRLFLRSGLRFLNAYPASPDSSAAMPTRTLPLPLSVVARKSDPESLLDLAVSGTDDPVVPLHGFGKLDYGAVYRMEARRSLNYHTQREPRRGRPSAGDGALFIYESLDTDQEFVGLALGDAQDLERLRDLVAEEDGPFLLGRSRSAQYGGSASLRLDESGPVPWSGEVSDAQLSPSRLVVTLTSALIPLGASTLEAGIPFPYDALAQLLGDAGARTSGAAGGQKMDGAVLRNLQTLAITAEEVVSGFSAVWRLPRPQQRALAAGSVLVFDGIDTQPAALLPAMEVSLGARVAEGYGRFVLNWHGLAELTGSPARWNVAVPKAPTSRAPDTFLQIVHSAARARWEENIRRAAAQDAGDLAVSLESNHTWPSGALLGRLTDLVRRMRAPSKTATELQSWKALARSQLRVARTRQRTLLDFIETALDPDKAGHPAAPAKLGQGDPALRSYAPQRNEAIITDLTQTYLLVLLKTLSERHRQAQGHDVEVGG